MFRSYRIGSLFGFPIEVNLSFLLLLGVVFLWMGGLAGLFIVTIAFASVLLHELGHALVARHLGVPIAGIELHFFGGAAKMTGQPRSAGDEIAIAAAGPAVSFALGGLGFVLGALTGASFFQLVGWINIILGSFNLIPALPMDGGRILRALLTRKMTYVRATEVAIYIARGFAVLLGLYALFNMQLYLVFLAVMLWLMGAAELRVARMLEHAGGFTYGRTGYRFHGGYAGHYSGYDDHGPEFDDVRGDAPDAHDAHDVEVLPRGFWSDRRDARAPGHVPFFSIHRPRLAHQGFVLRQRGGRLVIEIVR